MNTIYSPSLRAHVSLDDGQIARHILHSHDDDHISDQDEALLAATDYLNDMAGAMHIPKEQLGGAQQKVSCYEPREQGVAYRLNEEKRLFDTVTFGFYQTFLNVPVWRMGVSVKVKQGPNRVLSAANNSEANIHGRLPSADAIARYRDLFRQTAVHNAPIDPALQNGEDRHGDAGAAAFLHQLLGLPAPAEPAPVSDAPALHKAGTFLQSGCFFAYKYRPEARYAGDPVPPQQQGGANTPELEREPAIPQLPPVDPALVDGQTYVVAELIFSSSAKGWNSQSWRILAEIETDSIVYIESMSAHLNGLVFRLDPVVKTGMGFPPTTGNEVLNMYRDNVVLTDLDGPVDGVQHLRGRYVNIVMLSEEHSNPDVAPPTEPAGVDFNSSTRYSARSSDFGGVNAYYHLTELFKTIARLGFPIADYFDGTSFPIPVDHRARNDRLAAHCVSSATGIDHMCYGLIDASNPASPLCIAVDPWVIWHEVGGHGVLADHVGWPNFGFAHSAGDGLAAVQMDPESRLRAMGSPDRFRLAPFVTALSRRFDRDVARWAWGGPPANDDQMYGSEQILATCHFRIYRSLGGDHEDLAMRQFASRTVTYLVLRAIGELTRETNPSNIDPVTRTRQPGRGAQLWCGELQAADQGDWTSEGLYGWAYHKVIRWAFEQQGSYQPAGATPPYSTPGAPPEVDVYIEDGRGGEYPFQAEHWNNQSIWNRTMPDDVDGHQNALPGVNNYFYGKVKNRGTSAANRVTVRAYHTLPGAGLTWPSDFIEMAPAGGLTMASILPGSTEEVTFGPFTWQPNTNAFGHDCVLMVVSADGDESNTEHFVSGETIQDWRLVPHDNNIAQRNVVVVPGGGGRAELIAAMKGAFFMAGNTLPRWATMELRVDMPPVLAQRGWRLEFEGLPNRTFVLKSKQKRKISLALRQGADFTAADIKQSAERTIRVRLLANGIVMGGMSYELDPTLATASRETRHGAGEFVEAAQKMIDSLQLAGNREVGGVNVSRVSVDIDLTKGGSA